MSRPVDPYKSMKFKVEIDGIVQAGFAECSGLGSQVEIIDYQEGGDLYSRKIPGKVTFPDITLQWGITDSRELYDWHKNVLDGVTERKNGSIILFNDVGEEKIRWNFFEAWPTKWEGPQFNAKGSDVAIEKLTLCCERVERA